MTSIMKENQASCPVKTTVSIVSDSAECFCGRASRAIAWNPCRGGCLHYKIGLKRFATFPETGALWFQTPSTEAIFNRYIAWINSAGETVESRDLRIDLQP